MFVMEAARRTALWPPERDLLSDESSYVGCNFQGFSRRDLCAKFSDARP